MRASLHLARGEDGPRLGLRQEGSRRLVDVETCLQLSDASNRAARALRQALAGREQLLGRVHGLDLLESPDGGALVAILETSLARPDAPRLLPLAKQVPGLSGFGARTRERSLEWLSGEPFVEASVLGLSLRAHAAAFFQPNRFLLEPLARAVVDLVPPGGGRVLDLYSGVGLFALPLAVRDGCETLAVEQSSVACEGARFSARRAGLGRVRVQTAGVAEALAELPPRAGERIVLDPPRTGAGREVVEALAARCPEALVYVSCDPPTLGRDLSLFAKSGYRPDAVHLFDQFPKTFHVETVVRLRRL
jgi:23S rRNA (uracil1939-C5)-methyltransferase